MLDLYFADACIQTMPTDPATLEHADGIDLKAHHAMRPLLDRCRDAGADLPYFADSLLSPGQVAIMRAVFDADRGEGCEAFARMQAILANADDSGRALVAFCD